MNLDYFISFFPPGFPIEIVDSPVTPMGPVYTTFAPEQLLEMKVQEMVRSHPDGIYLYSINEMPMHGDLKCRYVIRYRGKE